MSDNLRGNLKVADLIVAAPILHLITTSLFLMGYYMAFGYGLYSLSSSADIFRSSVGNVGPNYLSALTFPVVFLLWHRGALGAWSILDVAYKQPEGEQRTKALAQANSNRRFFGALYALLALFQLILVVISYLKTGFVPYGLVGFFVSGTISIFTVWYAGRLDVSALATHAVNLIGVILVISFFNGLNSGQSDRRITYADAMKANIHCKRGAIIHAVGDMFLLVRPDERRLVVNKKCEPLAISPQLK